MAISQILTKKITYLCPAIQGMMIERKLAEATVEAIRRLYGYETEPDKIGIEKTKKEIQGDFTILVFSLAKFSKKSPETTANEIGEYILRALGEVDGFNVIKGFLNIILKEKYWLDFLNTHADKADFGIQEYTSGSPVLIEFSSPNTNKPLHLGHIRNNLLGYSLAEIARANGKKVLKMNLVNDRGIHICKSMLAYQKWGMDETPESSNLKGDHLVGKYYVIFNRNLKAEINELMEKGMTEEEASKQAPLMAEAQDILRNWEAREPRTLELWNKMNSWVYDGFRITYSKLGVDFDKTYFESETYLLGKELVMTGLEKGILVQHEDGSIWADLKAEGLDEKLLLRSDGTSVYITQDLGTAELRANEFHPSEMIYVVGNEQKYHFDVLKKILHKLGKKYASHIFHLSYGMVELPHGKMKSREGTVVDADDLIDEMIGTAEKTTRELGKANEFEPDEAEQLFKAIGLGALKYFILKVDPKKNMLFDPQESIDFNGNTGPFIQYTYARIQSLLKKGKETGHHQGQFLNPLSLTLLQQEKNIIQALYQFPSIVKDAWSELSPAVIANYIFDLSKEFNQFYQEVPVLKEDDKDKILLRLSLAQATGNVIKNGMDLLGIVVPEKM